MDVIGNIVADRSVMRILGGASHGDRWPVWPAASWKMVSCAAGTWARNRYNEIASGRSCVCKPALCGVSSSAALEGMRFVRKEDVDFFYHLLVPAWRMLNAAGNQHANSPNGLSRSLEYSLRTEK